jgi:hypothetical protein
MWQRSNGCNVLSVHTLHPDLADTLQIHVRLLGNTNTKQASLQLGLYFLHNYIHWEMELAPEGANPPLADDKKRRQLVIHVVVFQFRILEHAGVQITSVGRLSSSIAVADRPIICTGIRLPRSEARASDDQRSPAGPVQGDGVCIFDARDLELDQRVADRVADDHIGVVGVCFLIRILASYHVQKGVVLVETRTWMINKQERWLILSVWMCVRASHVECQDFLTKVEAGVCCVFSRLVTI